MRLRMDTMLANKLRNKAFRQGIRTLICQWRAALEKVADPANRIRLSFRIQAWLSARQSAMSKLVSQSRWLAISFSILLGIEPELSAMHIERCTSRWTTNPMNVEWTARGIEPGHRATLRLSRVQFGPDWLQMRQASSR